MASQAFEVTPQQLMNTASELEELGATYQEKITKTEEARSQMDGQWVSDDSREFNRNCQECLSDMQKILDLIGQYRESLKTIAKNYAEAEQRNVEIARRK